MVDNGTALHLRVKGDIPPEPKLELEHYRSLMSVVGGGAISKSAQGVINLKSGPAILYISSIILNILIRYF